MYCTDQNTEYDGMLEVKPQSFLWNAAFGHFC